MPRSSHSVSTSLLALLPKHETESPLPSFLVSSVGYVAKLPLVFLLVTGFEENIAITFIKNYTCIIMFIVIQTHRNLEYRSSIIGRF